MSKYLNVTESVAQYEAEVRRLSTRDQTLWFVRPSEIAAGNKTLFKIDTTPNQEGEYKVTDIFEAMNNFNSGQDYISQRMLPLSPVTMAKYPKLMSTLRPTARQFVEYASKMNAMQYNKEVSRRFFVSDLTTKPAQPKINETTEKQPMSKMKSTFNAVKTANIDAVKVTASIAAGKALNATVQEKLVPKMPMMVRGYAQTDLGRIVMANMAATALAYYAPGNQKAALASQAMIDAAMVDLMANFDIEGMVKEFLNTPAVDKLKDLDEKSKAE